MVTGDQIIVDTIGNKMKLPSVSIGLNCLIVQDSHMDPIISTSILPRLLPLFSRFTLHPEILRSLTLMLDMLPPQPHVYQASLSISA